MSRTSDRDFAVIVLNWNGAADTLECLASLARSECSLYSIVVDNDSSDDSVSRIRASGLADLVIETGENLGYAAGNNAGLEAAIDMGFSHIAVLNNDTVVRPNTFTALSAHLASAELRAVSPDVRYYHAPDQSWFAGGVVELGWPRHLHHWELAPSGSVLRASECLSGCCIAASRRTWLRVGLFDPRYFLIFEDSDWSMRARSLGVPLSVATDSVILHKVSRSFSSGPTSLLGAFYFGRNGLLFEARHARRHIGRFLLTWMVRPGLRSLVRRQGRLDALFRWLGAGAFLVRATGRAPDIVERAARRAARRAATQNG